MLTFSTFSVIALITTPKTIFNLSNNARTNTMSHAYNIASGALPIFTITYQEKDLMSILD